MNRAAFYAGALTLLTALSVSACSASSSPSGPGTTTPRPTASTASTPSTPGTDTPPIVTSPSTPSPARSSSSSAPLSTAPRSSEPVSAPPSTSTSPVPGRSTCTELTIRVLPGSPGLGYEFAALQFVNDSRSACTLVGVPSVTLLVKGRQTGTLSVPSRDSARFGQYRLAPGAVAESKVKDFSSCNAPLSTTIRVTAPGTDISTTRPGQLRACKVVVYPLGAPE